MTKKNTLARFMNLKATKAKLKSSKEQIFIEKNGKVNFKKVLFYLVFFFLSTGAIAQKSDSTNVIAVPNIADLRATNYHTQYSFANLEGYYTKNDGGGGMFYWDDTLSATDNNGTIIKPTSVSTAGRWKRIFDREINVLWFGAKRDNATDASTAINAALKAAKANKINVYSDSSVFGGYGVVYIPGGNYYMVSPIYIDNTVALIGEKNGQNGFQESRLNYAANTKGIVIRRTNAGYGAQGIVLHDLFLRNSGAATDSTADGVWTNTRVEFRNIYVENFGGNGFFICTRDSGNANNSIFWNLTGYYNARNGIELLGGETNNCAIYSSDFTANGMCGVWDHSFLGNQLYACHVSFNGVRDASGYSKSWAKHGGTTFQAIKDNFKNIEPQVTSGWENYWFENTTAISPGLIANWSADSTYWLTAAYAVTGDACKTALFGCYSEGGQGANQLNTYSTAFEGDQAAIWVKTKRGWFARQLSRLKFDGSALSVNDRDSLQTYSALTDSYGLEIGSDKSGHYRAQLKYFENDRTVKLIGDNTVGYSGLEIIGTSYGTPSKFGLSAVPPGMINFPYYRGYSMGDCNNGFVARRILASGNNSAPSTDEHAAGEFCINIGSDTTIVGWKCTSSGTPGTWRPMYTSNTSTTVKSTANNYTALAGDRTILITATSKTVTLPTAVGISGRVYTIKLTASGSGTVATTSSQTIDGSTTYSLSAQYKYVTVQSDNANWVIISNN